MRCTDEYTRSSSLGRTFAVLALLILAAAFFSYLWAYALSDALVAGHLITMPTNSGTDPRPGQMEYAFVVIMSVLLLIAGLLKWSSGRQIRRIDAMNRE
jgi:hypothetical protein